MGRGRVAMATAGPLWSLNERLASWPGRRPAAVTNHVPLACGFPVCVVGSNPEFRLARARRTSGSERFSLEIRHETQPVYLMYTTMVDGIIPARSAAAASSEGREPWAALKASMSGTSHVLAT